LSPNLIKFRRKKGSPCGSILASQYADRHLSNLSFYAIATKLLTIRVTPETCSNFSSTLDPRFYLPMLTNKQLAAAIGVFGMAVIASGVIRMMTDANGQNGLYFGLVMGGIALVGAVLAAINQVRLARVVAGFAVAVVLLWFVYDMYKDLSRSFKIGEPEIRKSVLIVLGIVLTVLMALPRRKGSPTR
jgi:peptidoglycan/LPS O-acetylase OafA/YrhL